MKTIRQIVNERYSCYFRVSTLVQSVFLATLLAASIPSVAAAKAVFERSKPHVNVGSIGRVELHEPAIAFDFMAELETDSSGRASGTMQFLMGDGSVKTLRAAIGRVDLEGQQALVFFLLMPSLPSGQPDPTRPATAVLHAGPGKIFWELSGTAISEETLRFELPGDIQLRRDPAADSPGAPSFHFQYEPQQVKILGTDVLATFNAMGKVLRDQTATGLVELGFPNGGKADPLLRFEPIFGAAERTAATGPTYIILLLEGAPLMFDNLAVAMVQPNPTLPGCDIWDFTSNTDTRGSGFQVQFDAIGRIKFHGPAEPPPSGGEARATFSSRTEIELGAPDPTALGGVESFPGDRR